MPCLAYWFSRAAKFQNNRNISSHSLEARIPESRCALGRTLLQPQREGLSWALLLAPGCGSHCLSRICRLANASLPSQSLPSHGALSSSCICFVFLLYTDRRIRAHWSHMFLLTHHIYFQIRLRLSSRCTQFFFFLVGGGALLSPVYLVLNPTSAICSWVMVQAT